MDDRSTRTEPLDLAVARVFADDGPLAAELDGFEPREAQREMAAAVASVLDEGGGVVTVASKAFGLRWGALGGMLITVDYFLTSSISATSAFYYLGSLVPYFESHVVAFSCLGIFLLAGLNVIGIRESATVSLWMAAAALAIDV